MRRALQTSVRVSPWAGSVGAALLVLLSSASAGAQETADGEDHAAALTASDSLFDDDFDDDLAPSVPDPLEPVNRAIFDSNVSFDSAVIDPMARGYGHLPQPVKDSVLRVFQNLRLPGVFVNDLLQLQGERAATSGVRFVVNTTLGLGGLLDPAAYMGLRRHHADFGQTLGKAGVPAGIFHVLPFIGPVTTRHLFGGVVDLFFRPDLWLLSIPGLIVVEVASAVPRKEYYLAEFDALQASSVDFYATVRTAYLMDREALVRDTGDEVHERRWIGNPTWGPRGRFGRHKKGN